MESIEDRSACATCGAANRVDASSCWQCFTWFSSPTPQGTHALRTRPPWAPPQSIAPSGGRTASPSMLVGVIVAIVEAIGGFLLVQRTFGGSSPSLEIPQTLGSFQRTGDRNTRQVEQQLDLVLGASETKREFAFFEGGHYDDFVIVKVDPDAEGVSGAMFDAVLDTFTRTGGRVASEGATADLEGIPHRCLGLERASGATGACAWEADDKAGFVFLLEGNNVSTEALLVTVWPELYPS